MTFSKVQEKLMLVSEQCPYRNQDVPEIPKIKEFPVSRRAPVPAQLAAVQRTLCKLQYNFLPSTFFSLQKNRSLARIISTAKDMVNESLPIRCLEATFLAIYMTQHLEDVDRIPLAFKSFGNGRHYRHIVLVVRYNGVYGALGLSRRAELMDKPLRCRTLVDLLDEYRRAYLANGHALVSFKLGLTVSHDSFSHKVPLWRFFTCIIPVEFQKASTSGSAVSAIAKLASAAEVGDDADDDVSDEDAKAKTTTNLRSLHECPSVASLLLRFGDMVSGLSDDYETISVRGGGIHGVSTLASPAQPQQPGSGSESSLQLGLLSGDDDDDDNDSDDEENRHRIVCIQEMRSPFTTNPNAMRVGAQRLQLPATGITRRQVSAPTNQALGVAEGKATRRLRGEVRESRTTESATSQVGGDGSGAIPRAGRAGGSSSTATTTMANPHARQTRSCQPKLRKVQVARNTLK